MMRFRLDTWLALAVVTVCLAVAGGLGRWSYVSGTATVLHPVAANVPSVTRSAPGLRWASAVDRARQIVRVALSEQNIPGLSVAVGADGALVWAEGFGWATLEPQATVTPETQFRIGSASMALTSAAVGLLVERGRLSLDDEIQRHVPAFPRGASPVTLRQLMAHTSGVRDDGGDESPLFGAHCERATDALPHFADRPLRFSPGTQFGPSSYGWVLVSGAVEAASGEPFLRFMRKQVFEPLAMDDTAGDSSTDSQPDLATSYFPRFAADPHYGLDLMRPIDLSCYAGAMVFLSTPSDLVRFGLAISSGQLLQAATVRDLHAPQRLPDGTTTGYGLGWNLETVSLGGSEHRAVGHGGRLLGGPVAWLAIHGDRGPVIAVTSNTPYTNVRDVATRLAQAFADAAALR